MANAHFHSAKRNKNDEFYTLFENIAEELQYYWDSLKGKVVFCNCDDPKHSNFVKYFQEYGEQIGIKELLHCHLRDDNTGGFQSDESIELLKRSDVVVSNPPFSLYRKYVQQLVEYKKDYLIIGAFNSCAYLKHFEMIKNQEMYIQGIRSDRMKFLLPDGTLKPVWVAWFTSMISTRKKEKLILKKSYNPAEFQNYDNADAIEVSKIKDIPKDYDGEIGVPMTFLYYDRDDFDIIRFRKGADDEDLVLNGEIPFCRVVIRRKDHAKMKTYTKFKAGNYKSVDNYDAIYVPDIDAIPVDYVGKMCVPLSYSTRFNAKQFEVVGLTGRDVPYGNQTIKGDSLHAFVEGEQIPTHMIIQSLCQQSHTSQNSTE